MSYFLVGHLSAFTSERIVGRGTASGPRGDKFRRMLVHLLPCRFYPGISAAFSITFLNESEK